MCYIQIQFNCVITFVRKLSRGAIYLDFSGWRDFLEEFVSRTRLDMDKVVDMLEECGRPSLTDTTRMMSAQPRLSRTGAGM